MAYQEGEIYVSGGKEKPWLYDIYDFKKIQEKIRDKGMDQKISEIISEGFKNDWDLKEINQKLGGKGFTHELQEIGTIFRSSKKKKESCD